MSPSILPSADRSALQDFFSAVDRLILTGQSAVGLERMRQEANVGDQNAQNKIAALQAVVPSPVQAILEEVDLRFVRGIDEELEFVTGNVRKDQVETFFHEIQTDVIVPDGAGGQNQMLFVAGQQLVGHPVDDLLWSEHGMLAEHFGFDQLAQRQTETELLVSETWVDLIESHQLRLLHQNPEVVNTEHQA